MNGSIDFGTTWPGEGDWRFEIGFHYRLPFTNECYLLLCYPATIVLINAMIDKIVDVASASD
jgi:hypothetical protein